MPKLKVSAPDGKILRIDVPEGTDPSQYDAMADEVLKDYETSQVETPGTIESGARGLMSGIPGATAAVSGIQALGDKTYEETRRANELKSDKAWEEHPVAYGTGKTAGMVGTALAVPVSIPGAVGVGAAAGLDAATKPEDMAKSAAIGTATGGAFGAAGKYIAEPAVNAIVNKVAPAIGKRTVAALGDPTLETVESYLKNPERIRQALSKPQLAEKVADVSGELGTASSHLSQSAKGQLISNKATPIDDIMEAFESATTKYQTSGTPVTALDESALKIINDQYDRALSLADANGGIIPEPALRTMIDKLQDMAKFNEAGNVGTSLPQKIAGDIQFRLKKILEQANPKYATAMKPAAEAAGLSSQTQDLFGIEKGRASDKTVRQMGSLLNEPKIEEQALAAKLKDATGMDLMDMAKASQQREEFASNSTGAALKTLFASLGFGAGKMTGVPFGGIGGAAAGRFGAEGAQGANMAKKILDFYLDKSRVWHDSAIKAAVNKYGPVLANAAKQGGNKLAATYFVLGTSDPEFQKLAESVEQE
jgi:hypothetical protein